MEENNIFDFEAKLEITEIGESFVLFYKNNNDNVFLQEQKGNLHDARDHVFHIEHSKDPMMIDKYREKLIEHKENIYVLYKGMEFKLY